MENDPNARTGSDLPAWAGESVGLLRSMSSSLGALTRTETAIGRSTKVGLGLVLSFGAAMLGAQGFIWARFDSLDKKFASSEIFESRMDAQALATAAVGRQVEKIADRLQVMYRLEVQVESLQTEVRSLRDRADGGDK